MLEMGARFTDKLYVKVSLDPDSTDCTVAVEIIDSEGVAHAITGTVTWDE